MLTAKTREHARFGQDLRRAQLVGGAAGAEVEADAQLQLARLIQPLEQAEHLGGSAHLGAGGDAVFKIGGLHALDHSLFLLRRGGCGEGNLAGQRAGDHARQMALGIPEEMSAGVGVLGFVGEAAELHG